MSERALIVALYCIIMTTGLPTPPTAPTGLSNGQITEGESLLPESQSWDERVKYKRTAADDRRGIII